VPSKNNEKLKLVKESSRFERYSKLDYWVENRNDFDTHIFTLVMESEEELNDLWGIINRDMALYFQAKLLKDIERWNIYIIFFVIEEVSAKLKYIIEQDKYCARKIIIDNFKRSNDFEEVIPKIINEKLFDLKIEQIESKDEQRNSEVSLSDIIKSMSEELYEIVADSQYVKTEAVKNYLQGDICNETSEH